MDVCKLLLLFVVLPIICCAVEIHFHQNMKKRQINTAERRIETKEDVKEYLIQFNYLDVSMQKDEIEVEEAIRKFQNYFNLTTTGEANEETKTAMKRLRCGCPDIRKPMPNPNGRRKRALERFSPQAFRAVSRWPRNIITWKISNFTRKLNDFLVRREIIRAFDIWAAVSPLRFVEQGTGDVDIDISFTRAAHGDGSPFDGPSGVLAHAFFPRVGTTHFDDDEDYQFNSSSGIDFFTVAAHEFGHALGLGHSEVPSALMAPFYAGYDPNFRLDRDDIAGIQNLYGPPTNNPRPTPRPQPTTTTQRPTSPTVRPQPPRRRPSFCDVRYTGAIRGDNGNFLFFRESTFTFPPYIDNPGGNPRVYITETNTFFGEAPIYPDAIFNNMNGTFFIRRQLVYKYSSRGRFIRELDSVDYGIKIVMRERIQAAVALSQNDVYLIGSTKVWKYNTALFEIIPDSESDLADVFPGIPSNVDAAFSPDNQRIVFIVGTEYFVFDTRSDRTIEGPTDFSSVFIGGPCRT